VSFIVSEEKEIKWGYFMHTDHEIKRLHRDIFISICIILISEKWIKSRINYHNTIFLVSNILYHVLILLIVSTISIVLPCTNTRYHCYLIDIFIILSDYIFTFFYHFFSKSHMLSSMDLISRCYICDLTLYSYRNLVSKYMDLTN